MKKILAFFVALFILSYPVFIAIISHKLHTMILLNHNMFLENPNTIYYSRSKKIKEFTYEV